MNVSIIIPNYNGERLLKENLPYVFNAVLAYKKGNVDIIVADDGSTDDSVSVLTNIKTSAPKGISLSIIVSKVNKGFSSNVNAGVKAAKGEIVILINTDVIPEENFLDFLIPHFKDPDVFAVGCLDKSIENNAVVFRGNGKGHWERGFLLHKAGDISEKYTLWASGGSSAFRKSVWDMLGGFNEIYNPFYWEDIDLSYRAWKAGYKVLFEKKSVVKHEHEKGAIKSYNKMSRIKTIAYRNQILFVWLNITDSSFLISHIVWLPLHCIRMFLSRDWGFFKGFFSALRKLPEVIMYREKYKQFWKLFDHEVLKKFS